MITALVAVLLVLGIAPRLSADPPAGEEPQPPARSRGPGAMPDEVIILGGAADISDFWARLQRPDLILLRPGPVAGGTGATATSRCSAADHVINAVKLRGRVDNDLASLSLEVDLALLGPGPTWVPLGIDCPVVSSAREGDRELDLRHGPQGAWEVRLERTGPHRLVCEVNLPVNVRPDRTRLELAIPMAPSTYLELDVPHQVFEVDLGTGEAVGKAPLPGGKGTRLSAHVSPRSRLTLDWTDEGNSGSAATPFLSARLEIAIDADAEWITTTSSWEIRCMRGVARALEIRLDEPDIVQTIKLDDQFRVERIERNVLTIPLTEPLRPGGVRHLTLQTRRAVPPGLPGRFESTGFSLAHAVEQSGAIGITPSASVWVNPTVTQGLRRIDPGELPKEMRQRPGIGLAFQFVDQPFRLGLEVEEAPPLFRTETTSRVNLDADLARTETSIAVQQVRGRLFDLEVEVPAGLELGTVDPRELVEAVIPVPGAGSASKGQAAGQVVKLHLSAAARDQHSLSLRLVGQQRIGSEGEVRIGLFSVRGGVAAGAAVTISGGREASFELLEDWAAARQPPGSGEFRVQRLPAASDSGRTSERAPTLVIRSQRSPTTVRGRLLRHTRTLVSQSSVEAQVLPQGIEVSQEMTIRVRHGTISTLNVRVPLGPNQPWQAFQGKELVRREELPGEPGEGSRYRLEFNPPVVDSTTLMFKFRLPLSQPPAPGTEGQGAVVWVALEEGSSELTSVSLGAAPDLRTTVRDPAWAEVHDDSDPGATAMLAGRYRPVDPGTGAGKVGRFPFSVREMEHLSLPPVVVPRALLRSVLDGEHQSRTRAWFWVESHASEFAFRLPSGSRWIRARIDGRPAEQIETAASGVGYRMVLPPESRSKPVLVELEYETNASSGRPDLDAPGLDGGAVVLQTFWLVQLPWNQAVIGVPPSWTDENEWYWDTYVWKRRPWRSLARLTGWVSGSGAPAAGLEDVAGEEHEDAHAYLFSRSGEPGSLLLGVASRAWLVAVCSGLVLVGGFLTMYSRARSRVAWIAIAALGLAFVVFAHPSVVLLILQSALFGVVLTLVGLVMQRLVERTRLSWPAGPHARPAASGSSGLSASLASPPGVGSEDSTAIRVRVPSSTIDLGAGPLVPAPEEAEPAGSSRVGPAR
jgi:hypothetical protein